MKQFFTKISRRTWIIAGVVAVILISVIAVSSRGGEVTTFQTAPVERGTLVASIGATGSVRARQSAVLLWQTTGVVDAVHVDVGTRVSRDEVLASLDKASLGQNIILAEADLESAKKALEDLQNSDTARAQALRTLDKAEAAYEKAYNWRMELNGKINITDTYYVNGILKERKYKGYANAETIADADENLALTKAQLDDARRAYERLKNGADPADVAAAEARVAAAQSTLNLAFISAPFDGTVTQAIPSIGDQVSAGSAAFRVDDLSHLLVDLQVSEVDINSVSVGQTAALTFDAILGKQYTGKVVQVGQSGDTVQGVVSFTVTVELTDADELVKPGMTAAVTVVVEEVKDVLLIPNRAVRLVDGDRVVYKLVDGQPVQVKLTLGPSSDTASVLVDGDIKEGDLIILNPPSLNGGPFGG
ncbi:MAG TPA: efflux RND transporter periplasmic adaptor subunit [Anaerolineales bacterium]|nr:efflux RND transporter periplasmic adaptor subunit [Anaerolineales bacterium]